MLRLAILPLLPSLTVAADWANWRGPNRDGQSTETGLATQWPRAGPRMLWRIDSAGEGYGAPAVAGGRVFLVANVGLADEFVRAFSVEDGKQLWSTRISAVGNPDQAPSYPAARSTPVLDDGLLYVFSSDGVLVCLDPASGKIRWQKNTRKDFVGEPGKWAYAESPLLDGNRVVVTPGGAQATMLALNKKTGAVIWKTAIPGGEASGYASAVIATAGGKKHYVQFLAKGTVGVDAATGKLLWRYDETSKGPANIPTPLAHGEYIYSTARSLTVGALVKLKPSADGVTAEQVYFERGLPSAIGGVVRHGDFLYGTTGEGLVAAEFATGKIRWKNESVGPASLLAANGHLYLHGEDGDVALVEAAPDAYREKGRFTPPGPPAHPRGAREKSWAYPVLADGRLYIRDHAVVWCYDVR
jgi:outer membrane protein assembly factor BamB